jgi:hypothetical protein
MRVPYDGASWFVLRNNGVSDPVTKEQEGVYFRRSYTCSRRSAAN